MQLTRFDRWLRETFVYETHIRTLRPVETIPKGIRTVELPESSMQRYRHLYIARKSQDADALIKYLREQSQMYTTEIIERKNLFKPIIAPEGKSFTWRLVSLGFILIVALSITFWVRGLMNDPKFRESFLEAIQLFK